MKKIFLLLISISILTGCSLFKSDEMENIDIYTTIYPAKYLINYLYGENSTIYSIYPNDVDFQTYELSEKKIKEYAKSNLFVFNSQDIDKDYAVDMININDNIKLIDVALNMKYTNAIEELWLNPYNYLMMAKNTKESLNEYLTDPYSKQKISTKYDELQYELSKLDAKYKDTIDNAKYKTIVTDNDLFKFLEKYNINVISLEEDIRTITIKEGQTLGDISKKYNVKTSDILTYNKKTTEEVTPGEVLKIPVKTIDTTNIEQAKKLIKEKKIAYIYTDGITTNNTVTELVEKNDLELITFNSMYSIDGGIANTNDNYFNIMTSNLELLEKELNK